jgi:Protein of unknown function (DUF1488)
MPLLHFSDAYEVEDLVGVRFLMQSASDAAGKVKCLVTYAALQDRAAFDGHDDDWVRAWRENRGAIEALASANYDNHKFNTHDEVLVDTDELTPLD